MRYRVLKFLLTSAKKWPKTAEKSIFMKNGKKFIIHIGYEETDPTIKNFISIILEKVALYVPLPP